MKWKDVTDELPPYQIPVLLYVESHKSKWITFGRRSHTNSKGEHYHKYDSGDSYLVTSEFVKKWYLPVIPETE